MRWRLVLLLMASVVALRPAAALAAGLSAEQQRAKKLFDTAMQLIDQGKHALACPMLEESLELDAGTGTKYHLARCYEALGKLATAHRLLLEVADEARQARRADRERYARGQAAALEPRVPRLTVQVPHELAASPGLTVTVDGLELPRESWGHAEPIDLGEHEVRAHQRGSTLAWREKLFLAQEGQSHTVDVPVLDSLRGGAEIGTRGSSRAGAGDSRAAGPATRAEPGTDAAGGFDWQLAAGVASALGAAAAVVLYNYGWAEVAAINADPDMERYRAALPESMDACEAAAAGFEAPEGPPAADVQAMCDHGSAMETMQVVALPTSIALSGLALALILSSTTVSDDGTEPSVAVMAIPGAGALWLRGSF